MLRHKQTDFISKLEQEALLQSKLDKNQLLPAKLNWLGRVIISYPWQVLIIISAVSAGLTLILEK